MLTRLKRVGFLCIGAIYCVVVLRMYGFNITINHVNRRISHGVAYDSSDSHKYFTTTKKDIDNNMKYILIWTPGINPFHLLKEQQTSFIDNNCINTNCYVTNNRKYLSDLKDFDAILFSGVFLRQLKNHSLLPDTRSLEQKYIFATLEPAPIFPITNPIFDNYFNWTWTYRLDSDLSWKYVAVNDLNGTVVGPAVDIMWPTVMKPVGKDLIAKLRTKTKAVAWFVSHCRTQSRREEFYVKFNTEFKKYGWSVDVFGLCGSVHCSRRCSKSVSCSKLLDRDYYFYFSFENSLEVDYVTEKLLTALNNYVVPVVYGGADYSRFLPPGSYLDAKELGPIKLAETMNDIIQDSSKYHEFFRWTNHYIYHSFPEETTELCNLCSTLNNQDIVKKTNIYSDFRVWWNGPVRQNTYEFMLDKFLTNNELFNLATKFNFTRKSCRVLIQNIQNQSILHSL